MVLVHLFFCFFFFFNDTATTEIYTLSLHDALPISPTLVYWPAAVFLFQSLKLLTVRSEEHTSELQSPCNLVCRLLLEKKKYLVRTKNRVRPSRPPISVALVPSSLASSTNARCSGAPAACPGAPGSSGVFFFLMIRRPPRPPPLPATTLFR